MYCFGCRHQVNDDHECPNPPAIGEGARAWDDEEAA